jgi:hypothetical protein
MKKLKVPFLVSIAITLFLVMSVVLSPVQAQGGVTGFANLRITNFYRAQPRTAITITQDGSLNATGTYQRITASTAVTMSGDDVWVEPAGSILILQNVGENAIKFTETATFSATGNIVLGSDDSAIFISNGTAWQQIAASNN